MSVLSKEKQQENPPKEGLDAILGDLAAEEALVRSSNGNSSHVLNGSSVQTCTISSNGNGAKPDEDDDSWETYGIDMDNPFRYGWRYIQNTAEDGTIEYERIPLTLEDLLHPQEEDFRMQNLPHIKANLYLDMSITKRLSNNHNALVLCDMRVDWSVPDVKPFGPDITVIAEGKIDPIDKGTYVSGEDGNQPLMVIEVTSKSTRNQDFYEKPALMQKVGLSYYFVVDLVPRKNRRVYGYQLTPEGCYIGIRPDDQGRVWMEPVGMWLSLNGVEVECYDDENRLLLNYTELAEVAERTEEKLKEEAERADAEAERADEAMARADAEAERADKAMKVANIEAENARSANQRAAEAITTQEKALAQMALMAEHLRSLGVDPDTLLAK